MTDSSPLHNPVTRTAQVISDIFSPIVLPTYMIALAMWFSPLAAVSLHFRLAVLGIVILLTAIVPTAVIFTLIKLGKVKDVSLSSRNERPIPYVISVLCYVGTSLYLNSVHAPVWLSSFFLGAAAASIMAFIITTWWKISAHSSAVGGVAAALIWMAAEGLIDNGLAWATGAVLLCGFIGTSRLILLRHTIAQVIAGLMLGAACVLTMIKIFN